MSVVICVFGRGEWGLNFLTEDFILRDAVFFCKISTLLRKMKGGGGQFLGVKKIKIKRLRSNSGLGRRREAVYRGVFGVFFRVVRFVLIFLNKDAKGQQRSDVCV